MAAEARRRALERALTAAALALLLLLALAAQASAQAPAGLTATAKERGYIGFEVTAPGAGPVQIAELVGSRARALTTVPVAPNAPTVLPRAATWRCDRRRRRFIATPAAVGAVPSAVVELTTPSCA
ncbi:MAG TPA: hypothetical protein VEQ61_00255, partial [Thermoleophilaceae bacterium]|nr:hypothetical protein [Thermoleophilaceae bacterium]